jgi:ABC-type transport system substrate-binding protein
LLLGNGWLLWGGLCAGRIAWLGRQRRGGGGRINFTTLDPYDANDTLSQAVAKSFYQGLFGLDKEMKLKNVLAESYTVSDDGLTYTLKLRQG